jgi:site-specific recombinase XerD
MDESDWDLELAQAQAFQEQFRDLVPGKDDWLAIDAWLTQIAHVNPRGGRETVQAYRMHLSKVRWYCDQELRKLPSEWTHDDVLAFESFLTHLPSTALRGGHTKGGEVRNTPFRTQPSMSSLSQIMRFTKAMFRTLNDVGFIRLNPAQGNRLLPRPHLVRERTVPGDLYDLVLTVIDRTIPTRPKEVRAKLRDRFIFVCFRECGLRMSEFLSAKMNDIHREAGDWVITVRPENSLNGKTRTLVLTANLIDAFFVYRQAFGLTRYPVENNEQYGLVLSLRTTLNQAPADSQLEDSAALPSHLVWRSVATKSGLTAILKERLRDAANVLREMGDPANANLVERISSQWLRHTFAINQLICGNDPRAVAAALGYVRPETVAQYIDHVPNPYLIYESDLLKRSGSKASEVIDPWDLL